VAGLAVLLSGDPEAAAAAKPRPPLVRAADRKADSAKATASPQSATPPIGPAVNLMPANPPRLNNAARAKELAGRQASRKAKVAKPVPLLPDETATLGYNSSEPRRRFVFPLDPGW
jgi:hypothetical protein